jgi:hypothetical protein
MTHCALMGSQKPTLQQRRNQMHEFQVVRTIRHLMTVTGRPQFVHPDPRRFVDAQFDNPLHAFSTDTALPIPTDSWDNST